MRQRRLVVGAEIQIIASAFSTTGCVALSRSNWFCHAGRCGLWRGGWRDPEVSPCGVICQIVSTRLACADFIGLIAHTGFFAHIGNRRLPQYAAFVNGRGVFVPILPRTAPALPDKVFGQDLHAAALWLNVFQACWAFDQLQLCGEVFVGVFKQIRRNRQPTQRFDGGRCVVHQAGLSGGVPIGIECATDVECIFTAAATEDERVLAVNQRLNAYVKALAGSNHRVFSFRAKRFGVVGQRGSRHSDVIAIDTACSDVGQLAGVNTNLRAINQATVIKAAGGLQRRACLARDFTR